MDVLLGSIDVRELLSGQDFEETSPLSAPDLRLVIDRLQIRSLHIKDKARSYILSHHRDFSDIFSKCSQSISKTDRIASDVDSLLSLLSDRPLDLEITDLTKEILSKRKELEEKKEALCFVRGVADFVDRLQSAREDLKNGRLVEAARGLRDLKVGDSDEGGPLVVGLLRQEWRDCFEEVQEVLAGILGSAVTFEPDNGLVRVRSQLSVGKNDDVELQTVLKAMEILGVIDYGLAKVADLMIKYIMIPTISNGFAVLFVEEIDEDHDKRVESVLKVVTTSDSQSENIDDATIYSKLIQVIKFTHESICSHNTKWIRCFGRLTWSTISELVISNFLSKAVPNDASKFVEFQKVIKQTIDFEAKLKEIGFISAAESQDEKLSIFAQNVEVHFASRKRNDILAKARSLLLQSEFVFSLETAMKSGHTLEGQGVAEKISKHVDLLFQQGSCVVSAAALGLMELVHLALKDVCLSSARVAMEFYHAARDALLLYQAIIPVKLEKQFDSIDQAAVLVHNDCYYLSQEILGLAFEYRLDFPSGMKENALFADITPTFCQMAEETLEKQLQLVISSLNEAIDGADGFQNTHKMQQYESAKFSIDQVVFILEKVRILWNPLLLRSTYKRIMCLVLESVFSRITKDVLQLDDMAAEETLQLQRLIHFSLDNLSSLFDSLIDEDKVSEEYMWTHSEKLLPSLRKVRKLSDLLDMPLKSITTAWESGELAFCGFASSEVQSFVKAIFTDSPLRRDCLWRIESSSF
ncbi:centromere/kinetochore protein zw10 homolog [Aristolochia californica]|uniref:centromere/kinetochore protein zw10 homolog n=1 Tax=Aristolochia californica TaxID=171875 RepID=UPI0035DA9119